MCWPCYKNAEKISTVVGGSWNISKGPRKEAGVSGNQRRIQTVKTTALLTSSRILTIISPVGWGNRIHQLHLCRRVRPPTNECPGYDTKQSDGEVPVMLELWGMRSTPLLPSLRGPVRPGVVAPYKSPIYGLSRTKQCFLYYTDICI